MAKVFSNQFVAWTNVASWCMLLYICIYELYSPWSSLIELVNLTDRPAPWVWWISFSPAVVPLNIAGGEWQHNESSRITTNLLASHRHAWWRCFYLYICSRSLLHVSRIPRYFTQVAYRYRDMYRITPIRYREISSILLILLIFFGTFIPDISALFGWLEKWLMLMLMLICRERKTYW